MKLIRAVTFLFLYLCFPRGVSFSQAFTNLDFESATVQINDQTFGFLDWDLAVPGWQHSDGKDTGIVSPGRARRLGHLLPLRGLGHAEHSAARDIQRPDSFEDKTVGAAPRFYRIRQLLL